MGYTWLGMRKLTWEEVLQRHEKGELAGCFRLYDDNSEAMIDRGYDFAGDILAHHEKGGEFGEEIDTVDLELTDGKKITAPAVVDVSALGCMDELEYELWHVIENYMAQFGIRTQDDEPDWATVKAVQDSIFTAFTDAGVDFKFGYEESSCASNKTSEKGRREGMRSAKEITESLEIAKGLCEGKTNDSWNARKAGRVMAELIAHFKKKEIEEQYDRVQIIATVVISKEDIDDIMVSALEGGITYWADKVEPRCGIEFNFASDVISKGGSILIHDNEEDATYELTKAKLLQGIRMYAEQPKSSDIFEVIDHELHIDCGMVDAEVADAIIQCALFGEIIYG